MYELQSIYVVQNMMVFPKSNSFSIFNQSAENILIGCDITVNSSSSDQLCLQDNLVDELCRFPYTYHHSCVCPLAPALEVSTQYTTWLDCRRTVQTFGWVTCTTYTLQPYSDIYSSRLNLYSSCSLCRCALCDSVCGVVCIIPVRQEAGSTHQL